MLCKIGIGLIFCVRVQGQGMFNVLNYFPVSYLALLFILLINLKLH